jgi:general secretion pathway protein C
MLDDQAPKAAGAAPSGRAPAKPATSAAAGSPSSADITKVSETEYTIERGSAEKMTQMQQAFMKAARVVEGQGIRLQRSAQTTILNDLGMKKGDLVKTINGYDMTNPDKAIEAYGKLKTARKVSVVLERDGQPLTLDYNLK